MTASVRNIEIDLSGVSFLNSCGLGALVAGVFWIGIYVGISYLLGEEIAKLVGTIGTKALIGVIILVVVGLLIRAGLSKWRANRQARLAGQAPAEG